MRQGLHYRSLGNGCRRIHRAPATSDGAAEHDDGIPWHGLQRLGGGNHRAGTSRACHGHGAGNVLDPFQPDAARRQRDLHGVRGVGTRGGATQGFAVATASAASAIIRATSFGREIMTTCEAPLTTTVFIDFARSAMKACTAGGMFLSRSP